MGKGPAWITFEEECWGKAMEDFRIGVKTDDKELAEKFLKTSNTLSDARDACKTVGADTDARYSTKDSPSFSIGGVKIKPKALFVKLLNNLDTFIMMGDVAVKGGPESVGLVWMGLKMGLQAINADYETCGIITSCFVDIVGVFISCRMYAQLYGPALFQTDLAEVQDRVRQEIPSMLCDILNFSFSASKFIHQGEVKRWAKTFLKAFKDTKGKFEAKAKSIRDHHAKLVAHAEQAAQQESILRGRADSEDLTKIIKTLNDLSTQLEDERKTSRKSFQEVQQDIFEQKSKGLNPSVDSEGLQARNINKRAPETCQWIFDKVDKYNEWRRSTKSEMLWLSGEAGFGKSILLATVIERLQTELADRDDTLIHYFYCRTGNDSTQLGSNILGNILFQLYRASTNSPQLLEQCNNLFKDDDKQVRTVSKAQTSQAGNTDHAAMYVKMGGIIQKTIYLVIDALDECSDGVAELCNKLRSLLEGENLTLKLLVSSRPDSSITAAFEEACEEIQMKEYNGPDIELKVRKELIRIPGLSDSEQEYAIDKITKKAEGEFSYVDTAINILREPWRRTALGQRSLEDVLENLPPGMHGSYDLMFKQISPTYVELAKTFLNWALLTEGEITVQEVVDAYNDAFGNSVYIPYSSEKSQQETLADQLDRAVGRFLEIDRKSEPWTIKLRHASVKDYFLDDKAPEHQEQANSPLCLCAKCGIDMQENVHFKVYKREGQLEMAITLLRNLNSTLFQETFMDMKDGVSNDAGDLESESGSSLSGHEEEKEKSEDDKAGEQNSVDEVKSSERESDLPDVELPDNSSDTKEDGEAAEDNTSDRTGEAEATGDQSSDSEASTAEEPDYEGDFQDLEDDYEFQELQESEDTTETSDSSGRPRYEITHWIYHLREAENRWSPSEREGNPQWKELWDQLEKFILSDAFKKWKETGWDNGDLDQVGSQWLYRGDKLQPLHVAAGMGLAATTEEFIRRGYDVNQPSSYGEAPLHFAAKLQEVNVDLLQSLLSNGANPNFVASKDDVEEAIASSSPFLILLEYNPAAEAVKLFIDHGANCVEPENTPIQTFAVWGNETAAFEMLVEHGADVNAVDSFGETSLHHLLGRSWHPPVELVRTFLKHGARLDIDDRNSQQPLYEVARSGNIEAAREILNHEPGPDLVDLDYLKMTAMHIAAWWGHNEIITLLKEKGAPLNNPDGFGRTPLMLACLGNEPETALLLLDYLSEHSFQDVNVPDRNGKSPLRKAARHGLVNVLQKFFTLNGAESFADDFDSAKSTALHVAAYNGHDAVVKLLLEKGADPLLPDGEGRNALTICKEGWVRGSKESSEKTLLVLIEKVPDQAVKDVSILYAAARTGSLDVIKSLLEHHADVNQKDDHGWSTLTIARQYGHKEVCDYLEQKGVEINTQPTRFVGGTKRLNISEDGLRLESIGLDSVRTCVFSDHPIPAGASKFYYEMTIETEPETTEGPPVVGIGLSTKPVNTRDRMPGWWSPRAPWWGFHSDDGKLFHFKGKSYANAGYRPYTYGDTVGCGFDAGKREVFYTINGEQLGPAFDDVRGQLFPVIGIRDKSTVCVNFGASDFKWKEAGEFLSSRPGVGN